MRTEFARPLLGFMTELSRNCVSGAACAPEGPSPSWRAEVPVFARVFNRGGRFLDADSIVRFMEAALMYCLHERELCLARGDAPAAGAWAEVTAAHGDYRARIAAAHPGGGEKLGLWLTQTNSDRRLICLVTHSCQLSCSYCRVGKYPAEMSPDVMDRSVDFLFTSASRDVQLQFFGGEPLLRFELVRRGTERALAAAKRTGKRLRLMLTTNGLLLDEEKAGFLKRNGFTVEISCDGTAASQLATRGAAGKTGSDVPLRVMVGLATAKKLELDYYVIMVVMPERVGGLLENFSYLAAAGHRRIQVNYALGAEWTDRQMLAFLGQLERVRAAAPGGAACVNFLRGRTEPVVLNAECTVDCDGFVLRETGVCLEQDFRRMRERFAVGDIRSLGPIDTYFTTPFQNFEMLARAYGADNPRLRAIILNNVKMGRLIERWSGRSPAR